MSNDHFHFLEKMGFQRQAQNRPILYDHPDWYIEIWIGNGDDEVLLGNKLTRRITTLQQLIRTHHKGSFPLLADFPKSPNTTHEEHYVAYASHWLKTYLSQAILKTDV